MAACRGQDPFRILKMDCIVQGEWGFWTGGSTGRGAECANAEGQCMQQGSPSGCSVEERNWVRRRLFVPDESMAPDALEKGKQFFGCMLCRRFVCERQADVAAHIQSNHIEEGVQKSHEQACERDRLVNEGFSIDANNKARTCKICGFVCMKFYDARRHFESVHVKGGILMLKKWRSAHNQSGDCKKQGDIKKRKMASEGGGDSKSKKGRSMGECIQGDRSKVGKSVGVWDESTVGGCKQGDRTTRGKRVGVCDENNKSKGGKRASGVPAGVGYNEGSRLCSQNLAEKTQIDRGNIWSWVEYAHEPYPTTKHMNDGGSSSSQEGWFHDSCGSDGSPAWPQSVGDGDFSSGEEMFGGTGLEPNVVGELDRLGGVPESSLELGDNVFCGGSLELGDNGFGGLDQFNGGALELGDNGLGGLDRFNGGSLELGDNVFGGLDRFNGVSTGPLHSLHAGGNVFGGVDPSSCLGSANSVFWARQRGRVAAGKTEFKFPSKEDCLFYGEWNSFPRGLRIGK